MSPEPFVALHDAIPPPPCPPPDRMKPNRSIHSIWIYSGCLPDRDADRPSHTELVWDSARIRYPHRAVYPPSESACFAAMAGLRAAWNATILFRGARIASRTRAPSGSQKKSARATASDVLTNLWEGRGLRS